MVAIFIFKIMDRLERILYAIKKGYNYNPENGNIYNPKGILIKKSKGERYIKIYLTINKNKYNILGHHFAWYCFYSEIIEKIDHISLIKTDNSILNLRKSCDMQNQWNLPNKKGYYWNEKYKKYVGQIIFKGKKIHLGLFENEIDANKAYLEAKQKYHIIGNIKKSEENYKLHLEYKLKK